MNEKHLSERPCPVCEGREGSTLAQLCYALFDDLKMPGQKTLLECSKCGMLYDDVRFSDNQLQEYYRRNEHYAVSSIGGSGSVSKDNKARYDRIIDLLEPGSSGVILDFGCGQGGFISRCLQYGLKAVGIEPSAKSRKAAQEAGLHVYESMDSFVTENSSCKIQAAVFSHVLEHLMNPINLIRFFAEYANDALVYIEVPDADSYLSPKAVRWQEMYFEHLSHFRKKNIAELASRSCVEIKKEGEISFSKLQKDIRCRFIVGRFSFKSQRTEVSTMPDFYPVSQLPSVSVETIPHDSRPLALWGVSQYAMLLLGSCPELLSRIRHLFDASPAKIGRRIRGIVIEPSSNLSSLTDDHVLLIPKSYFLFQMRSQLPDAGFKGQVIEV
ncbi:MAG: methyltransferase domain-containing protein [Proteobacteria bacterium]|nr:methyltransferase domain-containing protein [Pseudomonadota bacterium]